MWLQSLQSQSVAWTATSNTITISEIKSNTLEEKVTERGPAAARNLPCSSRSLYVTASKQQLWKSPASTIVAVLALWANL